MYSLPFMNTQPFMQQGIIKNALCISCQQFPRRALMRPCNHVALCLQCNVTHVQMRAPCPICNKDVVTHETVYFS